MEGDEHPKKIKTLGIDLRSYKMQWRDWAHIFSQSLDTFINYRVTKRRNKVKDTQYNPNWFRAKYSVQLIIIFGERHHEQCPERLIVHISPTLQSIKTVISDHNTLLVTPSRGLDLHMLQHNALVWSHLCQEYCTLVLSLTKLWGNLHLD